MKLWHRCLCVLLAYVFLVGPEAFQALSRASVQSGSISTLAWGRGGRTITYDCDANGAMTRQVVAAGGRPVKTMA